MTVTSVQAKRDTLVLCECGCGFPAPISPYTNRSRGYVKGEPRRFIHGHHATKKYTVDGRGVLLKECAHHGLTEYVLQSPGRSQTIHVCRKCRNLRAVDRRRVIKATLIAELGGECVICGYSDYQGALEFHHLDPELKSFTLSHGGFSSLSRARAEASKCVLLCGTHHAEVEGGFRDLG